MTRAIMIAAPRSGGGKTTTTLGLLAALRGRNIAVQAAKTGPDYIDPAFHEVVTGRSSLNLDSWAMTPDLLETMLAQSAEGADLLVVESAMGLFDGLIGPEKSRGAPSDIAARFSIPVILVLDVSGQGQSAAAIAHGFATLDPDVHVAGVVLNQVASPRHLSMAREAVLAAGIPVLGAFMRDPSLTLPERHLGLVQAREQATLTELLQRLRARTEEALDLDGILRVAAPLKAQDKRELAVPPPGQRIAIADDAAFSFLYGHVAKSWRQAGAELIPFSPLANEGPNDSCDACWLPGGYPELHAGSLAAADQFISHLEVFSRTRPVHGECGGFMVLGQTLEDANGTTHRMAGLLGHETSFAKRKMNLGYREATLQTDCALGKKGAVFRGHEFHYARVTNAGTDHPLARLRDGNGNDLGLAGGYRGYVSGSFFHVMACRDRDAA
ncbi:cobyrinic acid a,c-diamide synthase [Gluconobacter thailandicus F149-1 = NBRC 100600]|uniref:Cobyrinate a,c-diamide synthase n=1 Tax=Gluconobacter thailandicus NBRC 3257 TaxID=1381097 RepID=A0ABQ0IZR8_GLUTH|nr:cobyrinate a,c-diamide synthase [Gluconobacter thailandicus]KXV52798.1 cobyrinic acid a,c-diamide synthase [Gluconobacter thailandicus]GAC88173.1 cobyrinic acid a,c-diamide synthase [Gluconobacter thailandicus NBRC 3255]GAD27700.1 cobyrinic acid a,c-diamide synthase [Gluconobacter thailandicus NBRC 3257]GAN93169.1 cobyrinic acid a,c-diamide synthase [Gluconobacter thailandicus F149-1 = NBRC 100600]GBR58532.1 cobyrinic acid a,c-diamide synthase [Gluconobacter thailandicus F149-1 = NBRC 10060